MSKLRATGLGEPELTGKKALFQPPSPEPEKLAPRSQDTPERSAPSLSAPLQAKKSPASTQSRRIRLTVELTTSAYRAMQQVQEDYRVKTGKALPSWKVISKALEKQTAT